MNRKALGVVSILGIALATFLILTFAGSLDPPAAPAPTMKTLEDVEPRIPIRAADLPVTVLGGSYYLAEDIIGASGGITVGKSFQYFHLDLNGHTLGGAVGNGTTGVYATWAAGCSIVNGTIEGWESYGAYANRCVIDGVTFRNNGTGLSSYTSIIQNSIAYGNTDVGFDLRSGGLLLDSASISNAEGVRLATGSVVTGCTISGNSLYGVFADTYALHGRIENNNLYSNTTGIKILGTGYIVIGNSVFTSTTLNYDIVAGNDVGPIGQAATATSPWANFTD